MCRSLPGGSGGAATAGCGKRSAARAALTLCRVISSRPTSALAPAATTATPLVARNRRRSGHREGPGSSGLGRKVNEDSAAAAAVPASGAGKSGGLSPTGTPGPEPGRPGGALSPESALPGRALSPAPALRGRTVNPRAERTRRVSAKAPTAAPTSVGITYSAVAVGLVSAAARPMPAKMARPRRPRASRRTARIPITAANAARTTRMPGQQRVLVVGAERRDGEVLDRQRRQVDGRLPDRDHRRALRHGEAGRELADAHRDRRRQYPGGRPGE